MITKLLLYKILQLFLMMIVGFVIAKLKIIKSEESDALTKLVLYLLTPAAIINAFSFKRTNEVILGILLAFIAAFSIHIVFLIIDSIYIKFWKIGPVSRGSVMYSSSANLIIPIITYVLGEKWVVFSTAFLSVQVIFLWTHGIRMFSPKAKFDIKKILINPNIIAIALGLILFFLNFEMPIFLKDITVSFGSMIGPISMLTVGMLATKIDFKKTLKNKRVYIISLMRTMVYPIISLFIVKILSNISIENCKSILLISFLASITPVSSTIMQFAQIKHIDTELAVQINIFTTILSVFTMPVWIVLFSNFI
jgi:predicted permease